MEKFDSLKRICSLHMMICHQIFLFNKKVVPLRAQLSLVTSIEHGAYYDDDHCFSWNIGVDRNVDSFVTIKQRGD